MEAVAKLLYKQLVSCLALRAITTEFPSTHQRQQLCKYIVIVYSSACSRLHSFPPYHSGETVRTSPSSTLVSVLHSITPASAPHCKSKNQPRQTVCFLPMHFSILSNGIFTLAASGLPQNLHNISPPPFSSCRKIKIVLIISCACGICVSFSLHYIPGTAFVPHTDSRYYIPLSLQTYTSAPHSFREILISIPQATYIPFSHKLFSTHFQRYFYFLRRVYPKRTNLFFNFFLIDNFQRLHCPQSQLKTNDNKDFLS